jgi:hypothetical protein
VWGTGVALAFWYGREGGGGVLSREGQPGNLPSQDSRVGGCGPNKNQLPSGRCVCYHISLIDGSYRLEGPQVGECKDGARRGNGGRRRKGNLGSGQSVARPPDGGARSRWRTRGREAGRPGRERSLHAPSYRTWW